MDTASIDNSNSATNNAYGLFDILQKSSPHLDHQEDYKQNGTTQDTSPTKEPEVFFTDQHTNGKRSADEFDDDEDDFGPETDIDTIDNELLSPGCVATAEENANNNPHVDEVDRMLLEHHQPTVETLEALNKQREETPTPPADSVLDNSGIADNVAESGEDSEDEWNYYRVDPKQKQSCPPVETIDQVSEQHSDPEESEEMSQLNPDAKEFVPVSPTRHSTISPTYNRDVVDDLLVAQSPRRAIPMDISVPSPVEFQYEVKQRPSDVFDELGKASDNKNGHQLSSQEIMQNLLNGKDVSEIEFHPSNYVKTTADNYQFENERKTDDRTQLTPDNDLSGTAALLDTSVPTEKDDLDFSKCEFVPKQQDPMSMSFYQDKDEVGYNYSNNPFDLNKVQDLPDDSDDLDESLQEKQDQENVQESGVLSATPDGVCELPKSPAPGDTDQKSAAEDLDSEDPKSPVPSISSEPSKSPIQDELATKSPVPDMCTLSKSPVLSDVSKSPLPQDLSKSPLLDDVCEISKSPLLDTSKSPAPEVCELSKSPILTEDLSNSPIPVQDSSKSPVPVEDSSKSPVPLEVSLKSSVSVEDFSKSPLPVEDSSKSPLPVEGFGKSPVPVEDSSKSPVPIEDFSKSPVPVEDFSKSPVPVEDSSKSPVPVEDFSKSPILTEDLSKSPITSLIPVEDFSKSPLPADDFSKSPILAQDFSKSPLLAEDLTKSPLPTQDLSKSPLPTCDFSKSPLLDETSDLSKSPMPDQLCDLSKSPLADEVCEISKSPLPEEVSDVSKSPFEDEISNSKTPLLENVCEEVVKTQLEDELCEMSKSPMLSEATKVDVISNLDGTSSPLHVDVIETAKSPLLDVHSPVELSSPAGPLSPKSPIPELTGLVSPDITASVKDENISGEISESAKSPAMNQPTTPVDDLLKSPQESTPDITKSVSPAPLEQPEILDKAGSEASPSPALGDESQKSEDLLPEDEKGITDFTKETLSDLIDKSTNIVEEISHQAINKAEEVICEINQDVHEVQQLLSDAIADISTPEVCETPEQKPEEDEEVIPPQSPIDTIVDEIKKDTAAVVEEVYDAGKSTVHALEHTFEEMEKRAAHLVENVSEIGSNVWHAMGNIGEEMKKDFSGVVENILGQPEPTDEEIHEKISQIADEIDKDIQGISEIIEEKADVESTSETKHDVIDQDVLEKNKINLSSMAQNELIDEVKLDTSNVGSEIISFLERSDVPEVTSPLSPVEHPVEITCQTIEPQFAVPAVASPSEESKGADTPPSTPAAVTTDPELKRGSPEPEKIVEAVEKLTEKPVDQENKEDAVVTAAVVAAEVATAGVVAAAATVVSKTTGAKIAPKPKTSTTSTTAKKAPSTKTTPTSPSKPLPGKTTTAAAIKKTTSTSSTAAKPAATKPPTPRTKTSTTSTAAPKPATTAASKPAVPKSRTPVTTPTSKAPVTTDKKPLTNGDVKMPIKQNLMKKSTPSTLTSKPAPTKLSPTKTTAKSTTPISKTSITSTTAKPKTTTTATSAAAPKPRPASLPARPASAATTTKPAVPKTTTTTRPSTTTSTASKPRTATATAPKPRSALTLSKTATKAPDTEKQIKETANKQLSASRTSTTRTTTTTSANRLTTTKKLDVKVPLSKTTTRTSTTTKSSTSSIKKTPEVNRVGVTKTKPAAATAPEVPSEGVPETDKEPVIKNGVPPQISDEPQLVKDNSPVETAPLDNSQLPPAALVAD